MQECELKLHSWKILLIRNETQGADQDESPKKEVTVSFFYLTTTFIKSHPFFQKKKVKTKSPVNHAENHEQMIGNQDLIVMRDEDLDMKEGEVQTEVVDIEDMMTIGEDMKMIEDIEMTEIENEDGEGKFIT